MVGEGLCKDRDVALVCFLKVVAVCKVERRTNELAQQRLQYGLTKEFFLRPSGFLAENDRPKILQMNHCPRVPVSQRTQTPHTSSFLRSTDTYLSFCTN